MIGFGALVYDALYTEHWGPRKSMKGTGLFFRCSKSLSPSGLIGLKTKFPTQILALPYQILYRFFELFGKRTDNQKIAQK